MPDTITSTAEVATERAARYGKQLASHLGHRLETQWDDAAGSGTITFAEGHCRLDATGTALVLRIGLDASVAPESATAVLDRMEDVVGRHLVRFGSRDELVVAGQRSDGSPASRQVSPGEDE